MILRKLSTEELLILLLLREDKKSTRDLIKSSVIDYRSLFILLNKHRITGVICRELVSSFSQEIPTEILALCKITVLKRIEQNRFRWEELKSFCKLFEKKEIPVTVLKGFALDPTPDSLRQFNDVDVLIQENKILNAVTYLKEANYTYMGSDILSDKEKDNILSQLKWNNQYQFRCPKSTLEIEVHTNLFEKDRVRLEKLDMLLNHSELFMAGQVFNNILRCSFPRSEASLALLCLHTALKRSPANNTYILRQAWDINKILNEGIDRIYFLSLCRNWQISYYVYFALRLQEIIMGSKEKEILEPLENELTRKEKKLALIHLACFKDLRRNSLWHMLRYRLFMPFAIGDGLRKSLRWYYRSLFPSRTMQEKKYNISRHSPLIYITYLINPFRSLLLFLKQIRFH